MRKVISLFILICFFCNAVGFAQITPSAANSGVLYTAPLLRYLSVNSANPFNYFNFLVDKGSVSSLALNRETKKLINYFFLGLSLSNQSLWVNLRPDEPRRITSDELSRTDMGRVLLEQDLQLKKDVARYMHPSNSHGKEFWNKLYAKIGKDKVKKSKVATSSRVWIVPDEAVIVETEDGALIAEAKLKVMLENEYLKQNPADKIQKFSEDLMKEIVLPVLSNDVNTSLRYAPLRQIYHSLILAEWYKQKHRSSGSVFSLCIDRGYTNGLESQLPWSKQKIWQEYVNSYQNGEYKIKDTIFDLKRMYFSGGIIFNFETASSAIVSSGAGLGNLASRSVKAVSAASSIKIVSISDLIPDRPEDTNLLKGLTSDLVVTGATSPIFNNEMPDLEFSLASSPMERDSRNISLDKLIGEVASRLRASEEIVDIRVLLETGKTLKLYDREKTLFNDYVIKIAIETGALDSINNIDWVEFANKVWLAAQLSPNDVVIAAERELVNQQGILELYSSDFIPVFDSERFPEGTMRVSGSLPLEKRKQLGVVDKARRIMRFTEKDQVEILENIDEYVEHPAQRAVKEIVEKFEGEPYLSNAYAGEYLKGVWWRTKNGNRYFTPLTIRDYAEESGYEVLNTIIESGVMQVDLPINAQFVSSAMEEEIENFFDRLDGLKRRDLLSDKVGSVPMVSDILIKALGLPGGLIADEGRSELLRAVIRDNLSGAFLNNKIRNFISDARGVLAEKRQDFELIEYENINAAVDLLGELINSSSSAMKGIQGLREKDFKAFLEVNMLDIFKQVKEILVNKYPEMYTSLSQIVFEGLDQHFEIYSLDDSIDISVVLKSAVGELLLNAYDENPESKITIKLSEDDGSGVFQVSVINKGVIDKSIYSELYERLLKASEEENHLLVNKETGELVMLHLDELRGYVDSKRLKGFENLPETEERRSYVDKFYQRYRNNPEELFFVLGLGRNKRKGLRQAGGRGLGLGMVRSRVRDFLGGDVWIDVDEVGNTTSVNFVFRAEAQSASSSMRVEAVNEFRPIWEAMHNRKEKEFKEIEKTLEAKGDMVYLIEGKGYPGLDKPYPVLAERPWKIPEESETLLTSRGRWEALSLVADQAVPDRGIPRFINYKITEDMWDCDGITKELVLNIQQHALGGYGLLVIRAFTDEAGYKGIEIISLDDGKASPVRLLTLSEQVKEDGTRKPGAMNKGNGLYNILGRFADEVMILERRPGQKECMVWSKTKDKSGEETMLEDFDWLEHGRITIVRKWLTRHNFPLNERILYNMALEKMFSDDILLRGFFKDLLDSPEALMLIEPVMKEINSLKAAVIIEKTEREILHPFNEGYQTYDKLIIHKSLRNFLNILMSQDIGKRHGYWPSKLIRIKFEAAGDAFDDFRWYLRVYRDGESLPDGKTLDYYNENFRNEFKGLYLLLSAIEVVNSETAGSSLGGGQSASPVLSEAEGSAMKKYSQRFSEESGGIDLSNIELTLKDEFYVSGLNSADVKVLRAARALNNGWNSLSVLYVNEVMFLFKNNITKDIENKAMLNGVLNQLQMRNMLSPQMMNFMQFMRSEETPSEAELALLE